MKIGNQEKPTFAQFRESFLMTLHQITGMNVNTCDSWLTMGDSEIREKTIREFIRLNEQQYGFEIVLLGQLNNKEGSIEGVIGELYHVFSTMFLVEVINSKIRAGEKRVEI
ncbi:hypothetical protein Dred_2146 [Desulforamulus reducens MI-1]|uniref:Uncharacterized protein n=1 Tax=Desulforamulus reducens (strain ATCC BAA-1160 / DSM 100696 / MI-1) TaxID=349161 RepID=A4J6G0_DESRM|nr:hypothetical protein [Desulforamulus reducens]ABO50663.1 hypothetical protein Dred_2146 [Desulforamulus reducens MI-1]